MKSLNYIWDDNWKNQWQLHWSQFLEFEKARWSSLLDQASSRGAHRLCHAKVDQLKTFQQILPPSPSQSINNPQYFWDSHLDLFFRDWCWPDDQENTLYESIISPQLPTTGNILILGSGAGGFIHRLALANPHLNFIGLERNYLFIKLYENIHNSNSAKLNLYEFPYSPLSTDYMSVQWLLTKEGYSPENLTFYIMDFYQLQNRKESFDCIIAPWFLDILPTTLSDSLDLINQSLRNDGKLIYLGPQNFHHQNPLKRIGPEEIRQAFLEMGHESLHQSCLEVDYLKSPYDVNTRKETLLMDQWQLKKRTQSTEKQKDFLSLQTVLEKNDFLYWKEKQLSLLLKLISLVDGKKTIQEISQILSQDFQQEPNYFNDTVLQVFQKMLDERY